MPYPHKFPLLSGHLSLDLVNTEVIRRGQRHNLLITDGDVLDWLAAMSESMPNWTTAPQDYALHVPAIKGKLYAMRQTLRTNFEAVAMGQTVSESFITDLEGFIAKAPLAMKLIDGQLVPMPLGPIEDALLSLIALDALTLIATQKLPLLKRCANPDCILLFIDESKRRKWCSMKICGNRHKVSKFQHRKLTEL